MDEDFDDYDQEGHFTADIDAFADDTGFEGTYSNREFLFPVIKHNNQQAYDYFNPYDEDDCVEADPSNLDNNSSDTDPFGNSTFEPSEDNMASGVDDPEEVRKQKARANSFRPYEDDTPNNDDSEFRPYGDEFDKSKPKAKRSEDASDQFMGYNALETNESTKSKEKSIEKSSPEKNSLDESLEPGLMENGRPVFQKVNKSELPATIKMNSFLSKELQNMVLDENHFMLPVPEANNPHAKKVKIYIFGTKECREVHMTSKDKTNDVIRHMITILKLDQTDPNAYELRLIDDDEDYYVPFYEVSALEQNGPVGDFDSLAFCKNGKYNPPKMSRIDELNELGGSKGKSKLGKNVFTVYIKLQFLTSTVDIDMDEYVPEKPCTHCKNKKCEKGCKNYNMLSLHDLLIAINKKFDVNLPPQSHCFSIKSDENWELDGHNVDNLIYDQSMLDHKQLLKNLPSKTLELKYKVYGDSAVNDVGYSEEEKFSCSMKIVGMPNLSESSEGSAQVPTASVVQKPIMYVDQNSPTKERRHTERVDTKKEVTDFLYNEMSAKRLEEFQIVKINHRGKRQNRILGIDGYNIYNDKIPNREKGKRFTFIKKIFKGSDAKRASRSLTSIKDVHRDNNRKITITFEDGKNKDKKITYECDTIDICSQILAKLEFLLKSEK